jgi:peptidoglycan/LPS O-acetylase OafA/YrhL
LQWIPLVAIGRVSYSLYIWHPLALALLHFTPLHGSGWALIEIGVPGTMTMTLLSYYLLEKPYTHPRAITRPAGARSSSDGAGRSSASRHLHERWSHHGAGQ